MISISKKEFTSYVKVGQLKELFVEGLGWNKFKYQEIIFVDDVQYELNCCAEKSGFFIMSCSPDANGNIPAYQTRRKIQTQFSKLKKLFLIIFLNQKKNEQVWQSVVRKPGKPIKISEIHYHDHQDPELLYQRSSGLFFDVDEEDKITIIDVSQRVDSNFNSNTEKVTKQFYEKFKKEHTSFLKFINGIEDTVSKDWYASLMLNRLMFCYFIQKKGFLDQNLNYLNEKLKLCKEKKGKNKFYSFYRDFLLTLFHQGLGSPHRSMELNHDIGKIPYLNGGLFDVHILETDNPDIQIDDSAFDQIFKFFDEYTWHLDTKPTASGKDVNPDVIGYIFEKYINDRASMGAYYTKEDITDYISKNCIIPFLFDDVQRNYKNLFDNGSSLSAQLQNSKDTYIYDAVKYGIPNHDDVFSDLPDDIKIGLDTTQPNLLDRRKEWNKPAPTDVGLPTEIWREVVERRKRFAELIDIIRSGKLTSITDFITYNLNIRQFTQDVLETTDDPKLVHHFYKSLNKITILDPTCGSGAFLFAALNILEPLYETCLDRMETFVRESGKGKHKDFENVLAELNSPDHPNRDYFIYKSIILKNLYGVDIMNEAVEIAKLRLFLKLVATVEPDYRKDNLGLEPLPDVDFNIRAGNTLIGFATEKELNDGLTWSADFDNDKTNLTEQMELVAKAFTRYKSIQLEHRENYTDFKDAKKQLNERLADLNDNLNTYLGKSYGVHDRKQLTEIEDTVTKKKQKVNAFQHWKITHQPFHWFAEYYEIIHDRGGFDVVIGNPPYVEYSKVRKEYSVKNYIAIDCGNLFGLVTERAQNLRAKKSYLSFIVPMSVICTQRMEIIQKLIFVKSNTWISNYGERPSKLFSGAEVLLTIFISGNLSETTNALNTTPFIKWKTEERMYLFERIFYTHIQSKPKAYIVPKIGFYLESIIFSKIKYLKKTLAHSLTSTSSNKIFYRIGGGRYWKIFTNFSPAFVLNGEITTSSRENYLFAHSQEDSKTVISILSSSLFYWYFILTTNCRDLNPSDLKDFPISISDIRKNEKQHLSHLCDELMVDYLKNSIIKQKFSTKTGSISYQEFYPRQSKSIIDEIDIVLGEHYGFSEEELDFIINYDIKYRMGKELEGEDE